MEDPPKTKKILLANLYNLSNSFRIQAEQDLVVGAPNVISPRIQDQGGVKEAKRVEEVRR